MSHVEGRLEVVTDCPGECCWHIQRVGNTDDFQRITTVEIGEEVAHRLVACWNACDGVETSSLEMGLKGHPQPILNLARVNQNLMEERDELVNALRMCADYLPELIGAWDWKNGVLAGGADVEYQTLVDDSNSAYAILAKYKEAS